MTREELRQLITWLEGRVRLEPPCSRNVVFDVPSVDEMVAAGFEEEGARRLRSAPWWDEMVEDVVETGELVDEEDGCALVLRYAQDVVGEYVRKRFPL